MKLLFLTPPMDNWMRWEQTYRLQSAARSTMAYVRQQNAADVEVLDCRALGQDEGVVDHVKQAAPNAILPVPVWLLTAARRRWSVIEQRPGRNTWLRS
jgi:hypothetical protein